MMNIRRNSSLGIPDFNEIAAERDGACLAAPPPASSCLVTPRWAHRAGAAANTSAAFVPPNPKLLLRTARGESPGSAWGRGPTKPVSSGGSGASRLAVGGAMPSRTASTLKMASTAPAAPSRCPVAPLVEETARGRPEGGWAAVAGSPNTAAMARCSMSSPAAEQTVVEPRCAGGSG